VRLTCLNCNAEVPADQGQFFAAVFVCASCFSMASRLHERSMHELQMLQTMLREAIRLSLLEGRLRLSGAPDQEVSKRDVLRAIVQLAEDRNADRGRADVRGAANQPPDR